MSGINPSGSPSGMHLHRAPAGERKLAAEIRQLEKQGDVDGPELRHLKQELSDLKQGRPSGATASTPVVDRVSSPHLVPLTRSRPS